MHDRGHLMESPVETVDIPSRPSRLNAAVAVSVALLSTVMGIGKVKDDNIVQAMQQAQADKLDHWSFYQARNLREEVAKATLVQLKLQAAASTPALRPQVDAAISQYEKIAADQAVKKEELRQAALADQQVYARSTTATTSSTCRMRPSPSPSRCWPSPRSRRSGGCSGWRWCRRRSAR
jgi:ribosomal protein S13